MKNIYILKLLIILLLFIILYFICKNKKFFIETYNNSKTLYFCSHLGLGDNITNIGATRFLLQYYDTIYFFCKQQYKSNVQLLFIDEPRIIIYDVDEANLNDIINNIYKNTTHDILCSGFVTKEFNLIKFFITVNIEHS